MEHTKQSLMARAWEQYREIAPCGTRQDLSECFTTDGQRVIFWFNTLDGTTHTVSEMIGVEERVGEELRAEVFEAA